MDGEADKKTGAVHTETEREADGAGQTGPAREAAGAGQTGPAREADGARKAAGARNAVDNRNAPDDRNADGARYAIRTRRLTKTYRTKVKSEGLASSFKALLKPEWKQIEAVRGVDLDVEKGEIVAFIGPNGAGKSTFIKMLCGILHPSGGEISVLGLSPQLERRRLAMKIGTVFGQKSQLWLHLPAIDSFSLLAAIYEIDDRERNRRVDELTELFGLAEFLKTPVRKLSLGQRVRCEVAASLLHNPEILFLDEPTIGLDVVVKQTIRELIVARNRERGTTVFLTSHDPADIEQLCRRAVVIDHGAVVLDQSVERLRTEFLGKKTVDVTFSSPQSIPALPGVVASRIGEDGATDINGGKPVSPYTDNQPASPRAGARGLRWSLNVDTTACQIGEVMNTLSAFGGVLDITINNPPMEEIITAIFESRRAAAGEVCAT